MKKRRQRKVGCFLLILILGIAAILPHPIKEKIKTQTNSDSVVANQDNLEVCYIDVGQGDATLISKGDFHMLIDAGKNEEGATVVECLKTKGINRLDVLVGTHPDSDHIGGMDDVLYAVDVDTVYLPEAKKETKTYRDVEIALERRGKKSQMPLIGKNYRYEEEIVFRFLSPLREYKEANNNSLVIQLAYGKNRFLFMGDAEETAEKDILHRNSDLECDVLKVGHHGSYTATSDSFLQAANPVYAVISCGEDNAYGHPHTEVLTKLQEDDVQIYRTDTMGSIIAVSDGKNVNLSTSQ